jgi:ERCC4-type nuclease
MQKRFASSGIESDIICWPQETGCDYLIQNTHGSVAVQRKVAVSELISELDETMYDTLPRLKNFAGEYGNPVILIEENFGIDQTGHLFNRGDSRETDMLATSYFGYLETIRKMGVEVITTRDLNQSIWWMIATHGYLGKEHYPKMKKTHTIKELAVGMMMVVPGIGETRAMKVLKDVSIRDMIVGNRYGGLTEKQMRKMREIIGWKSC